VVSARKIKPTPGRSPGKNLKKPKEKRKAGLTSGHHATSAGRSACCPLTIVRPTSRNDRGRLLNRNYILSGAGMPSRKRPFLRAVKTAPVKASRYDSSGEPMILFLA